MRDGVVRRAHALSDSDSARMADLSNRVELSYAGLIFGSDEPLLLQSSKNHALPPRTVSSEGSTGILDIDERSWELKPRESMARTISACALDCTKTRPSSTELSSSAFNLTGEDELDSFVGLCFASALKTCLCRSCSASKPLRMLKSIDSESPSKPVSRLASSSCVNGSSASFSRAAS